MVTEVEMTVWIWLVYGSEKVQYQDADDLVIVEIKPMTYWSQMKRLTSYYTTVSQHCDYGQVS